MINIYDLMEKRFVENTKERKNHILNNEVKRIIESDPKLMVLGLHYQQTKDEATLCQFSELFSSKFSSTPCPAL